MRKLFIFLLILVFLLCKDSAKSKEDSDSILINLSLLLRRSNQLTISGTAVKGIIKNATVTVNPLKTDGSCNTGVVLAVETTDDLGNYSLVYNKTGSVVCLTVSTNSNGKTTLFDEKANSDVTVPATSTFKLTTVLPESKIINNSRKNAMVSPFSKLLSKRLQYLVKQGGEGADTSKLFRKASKEIVIRFGLQSGLSLASGKVTLNSRAANTTILDTNYSELDDILLELENPSSALTAKFISILVGFSQLANKYKKGATISIDDIDAMIDAFAADFEDGVFDGKTADGKAITIGSGTNQVTFSSTPLSTLLLPAVASYFQEGGKLGVGRPTTVTPTLTSAQIISQIQFVDDTPITSADFSSGTLTYSNSPFILPVNSIIVPIAPVTTGTFSSCVASPALPNGLSLNSTTCLITGTPTATQTAANYRITASGASAIVSTTISIKVSVIVFVSTSGNDTTGTGSTANPYLTIQKGIDIAFALGGAEVWVGSGIYTNNTTILIKSNVKLYGGYNSSTWVRNTSSTVSEIQDTTTITTDIFNASSVTSPVTIDGFKISFVNLSGASVTRNVINLSVTAAVTVANNDITSPNGNNSNNTGISVSGSSGHFIYNNIIRVKSNAGDTRYTYGIYTTVQTDIYNNVVYVGDSTVNGGSAIYTGHRDVRIRNNTLIFYNGYQGINLAAGATGSTSIENNIVYSSGAGGNCIFAATTTQKPISVANNDMFNCATNYYLENVTPYSFATIGTAGITTSTGNQQYDMVTNSCFVNSSSDWHLQNSCSSSIKTGGLDGSASGWGFSTDRDRITRTSSWSIGAYENDN